MIVDINKKSLRESIPLDPKKVTKKTISGCLGTLFFIPFLFIIGAFFISFIFEMLQEINKKNIKL